mgnify:CR=1 FL=1
MDIALKLENRAINPAVVNLFQFENNTTTLNFILDSYIWENSDLRNYKAYAITSINGIIDYTELEMTYDEDTDKLSLSWLVQDYTLSEKGAITYQIVFKEKTIESNAGEEEVNTAVWYSYKAIIINRESLDGDNHIVANYPTILKQWLDKLDELAGLMATGIIYIPYGETINPADRLSGRVYYQYTDAYNITGRFEDHEGNILIDNQSLTAVELLPNVDLNDIRESGVYYTTLNDNAATMSNTPIKEAFYLEVISMDENLTKQVWTHFNTTVGDVYTRKYYRGTWGEWYKTATTKYVDGTFLPLKGGKVTGYIQFVNGDDARIQSSTDNSFVSLLGGSGWSTGGRIVAYGKNHAFHAGNVQVDVTDGTNSNNLTLKPNGIAKWDGKNIVRTVGGVEADVNGNVEIDGMGCKAINVLTTVEEDTIDKWCELGAGVYYFSQLGLVSEQPSQYGFLINFTTEYNDVFQIWKKQSGGKMYYRSANANNWGESWIEVATLADVNTKLNKTGGTLTGELSMSSNSLKGVRNIELVPSSTDGHGGFVDFHFNGSSDDYTSRIIEGSTGRINVLAPNGFKVNDKNAVLTVNGELADGDGNVEVIAYNNMSMNGTTLKFSKTDGSSSSIDLSNTFATTNNVVDVTSDQEIGGVKTFIEDIQAPNIITNKNITNCITEIPQDIKLELNNGTVTLKAGSKVYVPNGFDDSGNNVFDEFVLSEDLTNTGGAGSVGSLLFYDVTSQEIRYRDASKCSSGTSDPANNATAYYDYSNNIINYYTSTGIKVKASLPLAFIKGSDTTATSIDQIFNGFGYIGSTVFALPNVKGLIPNGRNEDGSLKNVEVVTNSVSIKDTQSRSDDILFITTAGTINIWDNSSCSIDYYPTPQIGGYYMVVDTIKNKVSVSLSGVDYTEYPVCWCGNVTKNGSTITSFNPKKVFQKKEKEKKIEKLS